MYRGNLSEFADRYKCILILVCLLLTIAYYLVPGAVYGVGAVVMKTIEMFSLWFFLALNDKNWIMSNKITTYISGISMEMCLSHMLVFRMMQKIINIVWHDIYPKDILGIVSIYVMIIGVLLIMLNIYRIIINRIKGL